MQPVPAGQSVPLLYQKEAGNGLCTTLYQKNREPAETDSLIVTAGSTGLDPAASGVTGRRYNQLNYDPVRLPRPPEPGLRAGGKYALLLPIR